MRESTLSLQSVAVAVDFAVALDFGVALDFAVALDFGWRSGLPLRFKHKPGRL